MRAPTRISRAARSPWWWRARRPRRVADGARVTLDAALRALLPDLAPSKAAAVAARLTGAKRNDAYARALELSKKRRLSGASAAGHSLNSVQLLTALL